MDKWFSRINVYKERSRTPTEINAIATEDNKTKEVLHRPAEACCKATLCQNLEGKAKRYWDWLHGKLLVMV
jgi:hypothetical protein